MNVRTRIAPSPTGLAHIGSAYYALYNYALAKQNGGQFIVRIEDTDRARFIKGSEKDIFDSLVWLGIPHDEGPDIGGPYSPYRQSERLALYRKHAQELVENDFAYYCFCTPERLAKLKESQQERNEPTRYDRLCRTIPNEIAEKRVESGEKPVIRMKIPADQKIAWEDLVRGKVEFDSNTLDDQVILKSDSFPTYHLGVVVDDHLMKITHVLRGEDWISSTPKHILLYRYFGWELPKFAHMPLLRNPDKSKMSKRKNDVSIHSYKAKGYLPQALRNYLCLMGWSHPQGKEIFSMDEYVNTFSIERIQTTGPVFDVAKLTWMNQQYIMRLSDEELSRVLEEFNPTLKQRDKKLLLKLIGLAKTRLTTLKDFDELVAHFFKPPTQKLVEDEIERKMIDSLRSVLENLSVWDKDRIFATLKEIMVEYKVRMPLLYRIFTGKDKGLPLPETLELLGKNEVLRRLSQLK